jgi:hypothetical protein
MCCGTVDQILDGLEAIGETQRELRKQRIQARAKLN